jgi:hypothetical protein
MQNQAEHADIAGAMALDDPAYSGPVCLECFGWFHGGEC